jgi:hypothetical protein
MDCPAGKWAVYHRVAGPLATDRATSQVRESAGRRPAGSAEPAPGGGALSGQGPRRDGISRPGLGHCVSSLISGKMLFEATGNFSRPPWIRGAGDHFTRFLSRQYLRVRRRGYGPAGPSVPGQEGKSPVAPPITARCGRSGPGLGVKWRKWRMICTSCRAGSSSGGSEH